MSIHVGEVHTDVVPAGSPGSAGASTGGAGPSQDLEEHLAEVRYREQCRELRVAAAGFDD